MKNEREGNVGVLGPRGPRAGMSCNLRREKFQPSGDARGEIPCSLSHSPARFLLLPQPEWGSWFRKKDTAGLVKAPEISPMYGFPTPTSLISLQRVSQLALYSRKDYDKPVFRIQKNMKGKLHTWHNVKKKEVMHLPALEIHGLFSAPLTVPTEPRQGCSLP